MFLNDCKLYFNCICLAPTKKSKTEILLNQIDSDDTDDSDDPDVNSDIFEDTIEEEQSDISDNDLGDDDDEDDDEEEETQLSVRFADISKRIFVIYLFFLISPGRRR